VFRKSKTTHQATFFDTVNLITPSMRKTLLNSWAETFRQEVLARIPEELFAPLFSEVKSRPNAPINIIVGGDILKSGFGWTDEELEQHLEFDLLTRHALGLDQIGQEIPTIRTFYNLRRHVREYAQKTGQNLYSDVFAIITDDQISKLEVKTSWQRMDSTQLLSNIARMSRLELVIATLQKGVGGLPTDIKEEWEQKHGDYLSKSAQNICYRLKSEAFETHLLAVGELLLTLLAQLQSNQAKPALIEVVERVINDHFNIEAAEKVTLKPAKEMSGNSVQSPHDPEATYRQKNGESYKGYVTNLSETCAPENQMQLITSVQTAPNVTDDGQLLADALDDLANRHIAIEEVTVDGGFNGPTSEEACQEHEVTLRPTTIRGGQTKEGRFGWDEYSWEMDEKGNPVGVNCPGGQTVEVSPGKKNNKVVWYIARFKKAICADCPFFQNGCRVQQRQKTSPTLNVKLRSIQVASLRQGMSADNAAIRANVESTVHAFKHSFAGGKLRVRGLIRAQMMAYGSALMVNLRRIHNYWHLKPAVKSTNALILPLFTRFKRVLSDCWTVLHRSCTATLSLSY
jgi:hypothetical protein